MTNRFRCGNRLLRAALVTALCCNTAAADPPQSPPALQWSSEELQTKTGEVLTVWIESLVPGELHVYGSSNLKVSLVDVASKCTEPTSEAAQRRLDSPAITRVCLLGDNRGTFPVLATLQPTSEATHVTAHTTVTIESGAWYADASLTTLLQVPMAFLTGLLIPFVLNWFQNYLSRKKVRDENKKAHDEFFRERFVPELAKHDERLSTLLTEVSARQMPTDLHLTQRTLGDFHKRLSNDELFRASADRTALREELAKYARAMNDLGEQLLDWEGATPSEQEFTKAQERVKKCQELLRSIRVTTGIR